MLRNLTRIVNLKTAAGLCFVTAPCLSPAQSQMSVPPQAPDLSGYVTVAQLNSAAASNLAIMAATTPQFVGGSSAFQTLAQLFANYPCGSSNRGNLAHVSDLYGSVSSTVVCETDGTSYYWRPQRTDYSVVDTATSGNLTLTTLASAPILYFSTTPNASRTVTLSTVNAYPGASFHIYAPASLSLNGINLGGLVGGGTVPLVQGSDKIVTYTAQGWKAN